MANCCLYEMCAVSKDENALKKLLDIMQYKDNDYYIYRCWSAEGEIYKDGDYYIVNLTGDVAWSCSNWFGSVEDKNDLIIKNENGNEVRGTAHYITLDLLAKKLGIGIEVYAEESGCCFQEHYLVNHLGEFIFNETEEWQEIWCDDDGNELDEPKEIGGFDYYGEFSSFDEIYG